MLTLMNSTIAGNAASMTGGGLAVENGALPGGPVRLRDSVVANNTLGAAPSSPPNQIAGKVDPASSFNIIGPGGSGGLKNGVNHNTVIVIAPLHRGRLGARGHAGAP
jgi:hypothetical protein